MSDYYNRETGWDALNQIFKESEERAKEITADLVCQAMRADGEGWVEGYYIKTPLTHESTKEQVVVNDGMFFLSGKQRHCIATETGVVYEIVLDTIRKRGAK